MAELFDPHPDPAPPERGPRTGGERRPAHCGPGPEGHPDGHDVLGAAVRMSRMPMLLTDPHGPDNEVIFCNRAFEELVGYPRDEILGRNCRFLQGPGTDPAAVSRIRQAVAVREDAHVELLNYRKDGSAFWCALYISPVFDPGGRLLYFFASQLDVTRRREAEAALQQAQRLETLGAMSSGVAHEFNNLMTVILGSLSQLRREVGSERGRQRLDRAEWAARQAGRLTQQMLSFARRQFHDDQGIDLNEVIGNMDGILAQMARRPVALDLSPGPLPVRLDPGQLEQALLNLARNAADALEEVPGSQGVVTVRTAATAGPDGTPMAELSVADQGAGMGAEVLARATEPFFTTKEKGRGTGLGLSMVSGFASQSDGTMRIDSRPGQGTRVTLAFPLRR